MLNIRYGLRAFLLFLTLACVVVGICAMWFASRNAAVNAVTAAGGSLFGDEAHFLASLRPRTIVFSKTATFDSSVAGKLSDLGDVDYLKFDWSSAELRDLAPLTQIKSLRSISISSADDSVFAELGKLRQLTSIEISGDAVLGRGLESISNCGELASLDLSFTSVDDRAANIIGRMRSLTVLRLRGTRVSNAGVADLASLSRLKVLDLSETAITDSSLELIAGMSDLETLSVRCSGVTPSGLKSLTTLEHLTLLEVANVWIDENGDADVEKLLPLCDVRVIGKLQREASAIHIDLDHTEGVGFEALLQSGKASPGSN